jgi:hypothetical protein
MSRLDPINWPPGTGIALFISWAAFAVVSAVWLHQLLWTVLPIGLTLYLYAERYPWRVNLALVAPLVVLTALSQIVASTDAPTAVAFAIYLSACAYFSVVTCIPDRDRWVARLPAWFLGPRFTARLAWVRFEDSLVAANASVHEVGAHDHQAERQATMDRLATRARRESRRGGAWHEAWLALAAWLEALIELVGTEPTPDQARQVHRLLGELDEAHMSAIERTAVLDPA